jgi:hypothetical protein
MKDISQDIKQRAIQAAVESSIINQLRLQQANFATLPNQLQRLIAIYLMQQSDELRSARDLYEMVKEMNEEWAEKLRELDIERLLQAGLDVIESGSNNTKRKKKIIRSNVDLDMNSKKSKVASASKDTMSGATSGSKLAAETKAQSQKADSAGPSAELIISRTKSENKKILEDDTEIIHHEALL